MDIWLRIDMRTTADVTLAGLLLALGNTPSKHLVCCVPCEEFDLLTNVTEGTIIGQQVETARWTGESPHFRDSPYAQGLPSHPTSNLQGIPLSNQAQLISYFHLSDHLHGRGQLLANVLSASRASC